MKNKSKKNEKQRGRYGARLSFSNFNIILRVYCFQAGFYRHMGQNFTLNRLVELDFENTSPKLIYEVKYANQIRP